jgi:hypothetical protein
MRNTNNSYGYIPTGRELKINIYYVSYNKTNDYDENKINNKNKYKYSNVNHFIWDIHKSMW